MMDYTSEVLTFKADMTFTISLRWNLLQISVIRYLTTSFMVSGISTHTLDKHLYSLLKVFGSSTIFRLYNKICLNLATMLNSLRSDILLASSQNTTDIVRKMSFRLSEFPSKVVFIINMFCTNYLLMGISYWGLLWIIWVMMLRMFSMLQVVASLLPYPSSSSADRLKCLTMPLIS